MLLSCSRAEESVGNTCLVAVAKGRVVECFIVHDNGNRVEHVADWHLSGIVIALSVAPVQAKGFLVTSVSALGVGWSWIESGSWTVVGTFFQEIVSFSGHSGAAGTGAGAGDATTAPTSTSTAPAAANAVAEGSEESKSSTLPPLVFVNTPPLGSISFLPHAGVSVLSIGTQLYLTCAATRFGQPMYLVTALCLATELGFGGAAKGTLPYIQMQLEQETGRSSTFASAASNVSASFSGGASTGVGIGGAANGLGATANRGENDRTIVIERQEALSELDCTVVMQCHHLHMGYNSLRFCDLELDGLPDDLDVDVMGVHVHGHGGHASLQARAKAGSGGTSKSRPRAPASEGGILRVIWEIALPTGACWCTESYNNDGLDSRKLLYLMLPSNVVQVYNVNGLVCECVPPAPAAGAVVVASHGTPVGVTVARLPLNCECRRSLLVSTSTGSYLSVRLDNVQCTDQDNPPRRQYDWGVISMKSSVEQPHNGQPLSSVASLADFPMLPCSQLLYVLSPPEEEDALVLQSTSITLLAYHRNFGMQLLSTELKSNITEDLPVKGNEGKDLRLQDPLQFFTALDCHAATSLGQLTDVRRAAATRHSLYNANIPDRLVAVCATGKQEVRSVVAAPHPETRSEKVKNSKKVQPDTAPVNPNIGSVLYSCAYGAAIVTHAEAEVDISSELLGGMNLLSISHAAVYGKSSDVNWDTNEEPGADADEEQKAAAPSRMWPLLLSSRVLGQTGVIAIDMARTEVCAEIPFYLRVCADVPTVALLPLGGDGTTHSGLAVQVTNESMLLIYLEEKPQILKKFKIPILREVPIESLGLTEATKPLPPLEVSDDEGDESHSDELAGYFSDETWMSDLSSGSDSDGVEEKHAESAEGDEEVVPPVDDADEDLTVQSADNSFTRECARNKQAQRDEKQSRILRKQRREALQDKLLERETAKLERERSRIERHEARRAQRDKMQLKAVPWKIELAGALGNCLALAGGAQIAVVQLVQRDVSREKLKMSSVAPTTPAGKPAANRRAGTLIASSVFMEQSPLLLRCRQVLPANIAAMGSLLYQGQSIIAAGYWGMREVHIWCAPPLPDPAGDEDDPPVQGLTLATTIFLPAIASTPSTEGSLKSGIKGSTLVRHLVLLPLDSSANLTTEDLAMEGWRASSPVNSGGPSNKAGKLRSTVESANKKNGGSYITPITSVMALLVTTVDGSIFIYYIYMRQNKDFGVQSWQAVLYQSFRSPQRIINVQAVDTRPCNSCTDPASPAANHGRPKSKPNIAWDTTPNGAAAVLQTADGHYLLHFSAGVRAENAIKNTFTAANTRNNTAASQPATNSATAEASTVPDLNIGCLHEHEEMAVNNSFSSAFKEYGTIKVAASDEPEKPALLSGHAKYLQQVHAIRMSLMTHAERKAANVMKLPHRTKLARQHWLPRRVRGHVWTWVSLLPSGDSPHTGTLVQVPSSGAGGGYRHAGNNPSRQLLASLGFAWVTANANSSPEDSSRTESPEAASVLRLGAPQSSEPRFHPHRRMHVPGSVIALQVTSDSTKVVIGWRQDSQVDNVAGMQGVIVADSLSLKCLWRTSYPYWPPTERKEADKRLPALPAAASVEPTAAAPRQPPPTALAATVSMRQAHARLLQKEEQEKQAFDAAIAAAIRSLNEIASFTTSASGHRKLRSILAGLPPVLADGSVGTRLQHLCDTVTLLHDMTISLAGLAPMPPTIPCCLISVYALTPAPKTSGSKQKQIADAQFVLRVLGSYAYAGSGRVVSTVVALGELAKEDVLDARAQLNRASETYSHVCRQLPKYLLLACDNNISIVGWAVKSGKDRNAPASDAERSPPPVHAHDSPSSVHIELTRLQSLPRSTSSVLEVQVGVRSGTDACKIFVSHADANTDWSSNNTNVSVASATRAAAAVLIEIFSFKCDPVTGPVLRPERVVQIPGGVPSLLRLSTFSYPGKRTIGTRHTGARNVPERSFFASFIDQTYSEISTVNFKFPEQLTPASSVREKEDATTSAGQRSPEEIARSRAFTTIIEREASLLMKQHISFAEAEVHIQRQGLPEGLLPTQLLLNCPVNVVTRVGRKDADGRVSRQVSTLWALLDTNLEYHIREN